MSSEKVPKTLIVLAAGLGSRFGGDKQIHGVGPQGEFLLEYAVFDALKAGFNRFVVVVNAMVESQVRKRLEPLVGNERLFLVFQSVPSFRSKPWGTGHAVLSAKSFINGLFMVVNGDDFYGRRTYEKAAMMMDAGEIHRNHYGLIAYPLSTTLSKNGPVSRGVCAIDSDANLIHIKEHTGIERQSNNEITSSETSVFLENNASVSMNCWLFHDSVFQHLEDEFKFFLHKNGENNNTEFYLPAAIQAALEAKKISVKVSLSSAQWFGLTYAEDRADVQALLLKLTQEGEYPNHSTDE